MEKHPEVGGDTAWVSGYGLYDELSPHIQQLLEGLHTIHTSRYQYETTIVSTHLPFGHCISYCKLTWEISKYEITDSFLTGLLQRRAQPSTNRHASPRNPHTPSDRLKSSQRKPCLLHRLRRAEESRVRRLITIPELAHPQFR